MSRAFQTSGYRVYVNVHNGVSYHVILLEHSPTQISIGSFEYREKILRFFPLLACSSHRPPSLSSLIRPKISFLLTLYQIFIQNVILLSMPFNNSGQSTTQDYLRSFFVRRQIFCDKGRKNHFRAKRYPAKDYSALS